MRPVTEAYRKHLCLIGTGVTVQPARRFEVAFAFDKPTAYGFAGCDAWYHVNELITSNTFIRCHLVGAPRLLAVPDRGL
jgi:hypothetical protein